jgi:hypothetical protein
MIDKATLDRNGDIVADVLIGNMNRTLDIVSKLLNQEMSRGLLNMILKPAFKVLYNMLIKGSIRRMGKESIEDHIELCKSIILDGIDTSGDRFQERLDGLFPQLLEHDQIGRLCKRKHKNFPVFTDMARVMFDAQSVYIIHLIGTDGEFTDIGGLCRVAFPRKRDATAVLNRQLNAIKDMLKLVEKDLSILNVPTSRSLVYRVLVKGYMEMIDEINRDVNEIYDGLG